MESMKSNLNKLLCERPRHQSSDNFSFYRHKKGFEVFDDENTHTRESMKVRFGFDTKNFSEHFAPLWGIIRKNTGRKWDDVYSEICQNFDKRSVINQHILIHLFQFVATKTYEEDGEIYAIGDYRTIANIKDSLYEYYVNPQTGILLKNKWYKGYKKVVRDREKQRMQEELKTRRVIEEGKLELRKREDDGVWFFCEIAEIPRYHIRKYLKDGELVETKTTGFAHCVWEKKKVDWWQNKTYVKKIRSASHKELKKLKLAA